MSENDSNLQQEIEKLKKENRRLRKDLRRLREVINEAINNKKKPSICCLCGSYFAADHKSQKYCASCQSEKKPKIDTMQKNVRRRGEDWDSSIDKIILQIRRTLDANDSYEDFQKMKAEFNQQNQYYDKKFIKKYKITENSKYDYVKSYEEYKEWLKAYLKKIRRIVNG